MANYKRKKPRSQVRCGMCTDARGGNSNKTIGRHPKKAEKFKPTVKENDKSWRP